MLPRVLNPDPISRWKKWKLIPYLKPEPEKSHPIQGKRRPKISMKHKNPHILRVKFSFKRWFVSNVARHSSTWILPDMITIPNLRITPGTKCQQGQNWYPYLRMENLRNHAPHWAAHTYLAYLWEYPWGLQQFTKRLHWKSLTPRYCDSF